MLIMFAEVRQDGKWHKVGKVFESTFEELDGQLTDRVFDGRNNELVVFLANHSYSDSASYLNLSEECKNHQLLRDKIVYMSNLREILGLNWGKELYELGYISEWQYKRLKENGIEPANILQKPLYKDDAVVTPFMMDMIMDYPSLRTASKYYVQYEYDKKTMREQCDFFCNKSIPGLIKLIPEGGTAEDVRIVFSL